MTIVNLTGYTLYELYFADSLDAGWGADRLGSDVLLDDEYVYFDVPPNSGSSYNIAAVDSDGDEYYVFDFDYCLDGESLSYGITLDDLYTGR